jgi:hypothetical protein
MVDIPQVNGYAKKKEPDDVRFIDDAELARLKAEHKIVDAIYEVRKAMQLTNEHQPITGFVLGSLPLVLDGPECEEMGMIYINVDHQPVSYGLHDLDRVIVVAKDRV